MKRRANYKNQTIIKSSLEIKKELKNRIEWVDIAKGICTFFVLYSHTDRNTLFMARVYYPFFLNGFLFLSGYTFTLKNKFLAFIKRKSKQLLIPWLIFGTIVIITGNIYSPTPELHNGLIKDYLWFLFQIRPINDAMWFVSALFVAYIPFYFVIRKYEKNKTKSGLLFFLAFFTLYILSILYKQNIKSDFFPWGSNGLPWHIEYIPNAIFYMLLGYYFRSNQQIEAFVHSKRIILTTIILPLYLIVIHSGTTGITYQLVSEFLGVLSLILISKIIKFNKTIITIGQNSLFYFGCGHYFRFLVETIMKYILNEKYNLLFINDFNATLITIIISIITILIMIPFAKIINKKMPWVVGKISD